VLPLFCAAAIIFGEPGIAGADWRNEWQVADGFSLTIDTEGYDFPTTIAFVPNPGSDPKSPLYFVTEIRGKVKVVTNDRSIYTFADLAANQPQEELPALSGETGMAGLVLEPEKGYVFVSFAYPDAGNLLRNNIVRFETKPGVFGLQPDSSTSFTEIFAAHPSHLSHQIGRVTKATSTWVWATQSSLRVPGTSTPRSARS
jgi:hypothetical protein